VLEDMEKLKEEQALLLGDGAGALDGKGGVAAAAAFMLREDGVTPEEKDETKTDLEDVVDRVTRLQKTVKILQLMVKDLTLTRKQKEDDPHYKPYSNYKRDIEEEKRLYGKRLAG